LRRLRKESHDLTHSQIISSRENFVTALDYGTNAVKWILGDTTKKWAGFPSLLKHSLDLGPNSLPPIGQHAVSITHGDSLLLLDNGRNHQRPYCREPK
jgi:hypothetical protein